MKIRINDVIRTIKRHVDNVIENCFESYKKDYKIRAIENSLQVSQ